MSYKQVCLAEFFLFHRGSVNFAISSRLQNKTPDGWNYLDLAI